MKDIFVILLFGVFFSISIINAQIPLQTPSQKDAVSSLNGEDQKSAQRPVRIEGVLNSEFQDLGMFRPAGYQFIATTKRDKELTLVREDKSKYAAFLRNSKTGIMRLHDAENCDEGGRTIAADEPCPWNIIGKATLYSFRTQKYTNKLFSDIKLEEKIFKATGLNLLGFFTDLGDVPIENLSLESKGIKEMASFQPSTDLQEAKRQFNKVKKGLKIGEYVFENTIQMETEKVYAARFIAFDSRVNRRIGKFRVNILGEDKRRDTIVVFRVVRENEDGSVNILWKKLQEKNAPKIRPKK